MATAVVPICNMKQPLQVLLVEDSDDDAILLLPQLKRGGYEVVHSRVESAAQVNDALAQEPWDVVISDYAMPGFSGLDALRMVQEHGLDIPFILVSGQIGEDMAVAAMKAGAHDYLMKDKLARLAAGGGREIREAEARRALRRVDLALLVHDGSFLQVSENL